MELFGKKKPLRGIIEPPKAINPAPLSPLLNGHLIAFTDLHAKDPLANLHANHLIGYWAAPGNKMIRPENVTIEFALPEGFVGKKFEEHYRKITDRVSWDSWMDSLARHGFKTKYNESGEIRAQWRSYDEDKKKETEKMDKLHLFELEATDYLNRSKFEKRGLSPELAERTRKMLKVPFQMRAAGYKVRIGTYEEIKKIREEDAKNGIATPHRITVHLPLTKDEAIIADERIQQEHAEECRKCAVFREKNPERTADPSCPNRSVISYFGIPEKERTEIRRRLAAKYEASERALSAGNNVNRATMAKA